MSDDYKVKGSSIRSKFDFVAERFGGPAERELRDSFNEHRELFPVLDSSMYPFALYDAVIRAIADRFFDGDLARLEEVGAHSAHTVLTTIYKAFAEGKDFRGFLRRAALLHQRFYSQGEMTVEIEENEPSARIHITGAPTYSQADLHIAAGFYTGAARLLGLDTIRCEFQVDDSGAHYQLAWD